jgi:nucleotide-binding universal stress UspA family protein
MAPLSLLGSIEFDSLSVGYTLSGADHFLVRIARVGAMGGQALNHTKERSIYPHILVPIDGSETSACALDEAIKLAKILDSRLRLLHVVNEHVLDVTSGGGTYADGLIEFLRAQGEKIVRDAMSLVRRQGVDAETVVLESIGGAAAYSIVEQAKQWPAQLIVMGTHGRHGLRRLALGSDSESVVRDSSVPVLLVRRGENPIGDSSHSVR